MRTIKSLAVLTALVLVGQSHECLAAATEDGLALAIIYDTSGSMKETVRDSTGKATPKYIIANRSLAAIASRIQDYATNTPPDRPRRVETGLFIFEGRSAREALPFGPFSQASLRNWSRQFSTPRGDTPLGNALSIATRRILNSPLSRKHVLVITDGKNTAGPSPEQVLPGLQQLARRGEKSFSVHFVAFDIDAKQFERVRKLGATVVGAADERQLNAQLDFILQNKILLEEEETPKTK